MGGGTGQGLSGFHFGAVDNVVTGKHTDADGWQVGRIGIDADAVGDAGAVARSIGEGGDQVMAAIGQGGEVGRRQAGAP
ncbi:hypothetical protein D3C76_1700350 [compost metagenome]